MCNSRNEYDCKIMSQTSTLKYSHRDQGYFDYPCDNAGDTSDGKDETSRSGQEFLDSSDEDDYERVPHTTIVRYKQRHWLPSDNTSDNIETTSKSKLGSFRCEIDLDNSGDEDTYEIMHETAVVKYKPRGHMYQHATYKKVDETLESQNESCPGGTSHELSGSSYEEVLYTIPQTPSVSYKPRHQLYRNDAHNVEETSGDKNENSQGERGQGVSDSSDEHIYENMHSISSFRHESRHQLYLGKIDDKVENTSIGKIEGFSCSQESYHSSKEATDDIIPQFAMPIFKPRGQRYLLTSEGQNESCPGETCHELSDSSYQDVLYTTPQTPSVSYKPRHQLYRNDAHNVEETSGDNYENSKGERDKGVSDSSDEYDYENMPSILSFRHKPRHQLNLGKIDDKVENTCPELSDSSYEDVHYTIPQTSPVSYKPRHHLYRGNDAGNVEETSGGKNENCLGGSDQVLSHSSDEDDYENMFQTLSFRHKHLQKLYPRNTDDSMEGVTDSSDEDDYENMPTNSTDRCKPLGQRYIYSTYQKVCDTSEGQNESSLERNCPEVSDSSYEDVYDMMPPASSLKYKLRDQTLLNNLHENIEDATEGITKTFQCGSDQGSLDSSDENDYENMPPIPKLPIESRHEAYLVNKGNHRYSVRGNDQGLSDSSVEDDYENITQISPSKYKHLDKKLLYNTRENVEDFPKGKNEGFKCRIGLLDSSDTEDDMYTQIDNSDIAKDIDSNYESPLEVDHNDSKNEIESNVIDSLTVRDSISNPTYVMLHDNHYDVPRTLFVGISILDDGNVIVVSRDGHIIVYSASYEYLSLAKFPYNFNDVTSIPKKGFATTSGYCINFFTLQNDQVIEQDDKCIDRQFTTETTFHGLVCSRDKLIVSCNVLSVRDSFIKPFISFLNMTGKVLSKMSNDCLVMPTNIECSHDGHLIFVLDTGCNSVVCFNHAGNIIWKASFPNEPTYFVTLRKTLVVALPTGISSFHIASGKPCKGKKELRGEKVILAYNTANKELVWCSQTMNIPPTFRLASVRVKKGKLKGKLIKKLLNVS